MFHLDIILAACDVEGNFVVVKVSSSSVAEITFLMVSLTQNTPGLSVYESSFMHAPRCVSPVSAEPLQIVPIHLF
jgi:hypothetical protein